MALRYEHIELDISTRSCDLLLKLLTEGNISYTIQGDDALVNLANELRARLQRTDVDPHCPKNFVTPPTADWLDT